METLTVTDVDFYMAADEALGLVEEGGWDRLWGFAGYLGEDD